MSFSALKKQINKANQFLSESVGVAEATKLDDEFNEMERKVDLTNELVGALVAATQEHLQPNPAIRAKIAALGAMSKVRGSTKSQAYPQTEGILADIMSKYGRGLGNGSDLGKVLCDASESFRQMADVKYQLEDTVKHNFIDPVTDFQTNDLKDFNAHRAKLRSRRLDYDCKKRKQVKDDELVQAEEKLEESKRLTEKSMFNVLSNDVEQISQLKAFVVAQLEFHRQTSQILDNLRNQLDMRINDANRRQRTEHVPKPIVSRNSARNLDSLSIADNVSHASFGSSRPPSASTFPPTLPSTLPPVNGSSISIASAPPAMGTNDVAIKKGKCKALFKFEALNPGELDFKEGEIIQLDSQIDEHWFEGTLNGRSGFFPITYVDVIEPLPR